MKCVCMKDQEKPPTTLKLAKLFWRHMSPRRKKQLWVLLVLMIVTSLTEVMGLGAVLPLLAVLTAPDKVFEYVHLQPLWTSIGIKAPEELLLPIVLLFIFVAILTGAMRILLLYVNTKLSFAIGADFSYEMYRRTLYQPYAVHISRNSSEIISGITGKSGTIISGLLMPLMTVVSSILMLISILAALLSVDPWVCIAAFVGFSAIYAGVVLTTRRQLATDSLRIARESTRVVKALQEALNGIRDVLLDGSQAEYCKIYRQADSPLRRAQASSAIIGGTPRFAAEGLGMAFIALLAYAIAKQPGSMTSAITTLGVLAIGAQRMLPIFQQCYGSLVVMRSSNASLHDALMLLRQPVDPDIYGGSHETLSFDRDVVLKDINFQYAEDGPHILKNINLSIEKGKRIGFIGSTGSGKSTLVDIIMGLLIPKSGEISVDGTLLGPKKYRAWQNKISHVPQVIYLSDSSIAENIAFGVPKEDIDLNRVRDAASQAQIADHIESLPDSYNTFVGERGVRLSGGQRQRICIARALYKKSEIIVFDEATSALDNETERAVMDAVDKLGDNLTIIIIAHRLSTLRKCHKVVELKNGQLVRSGTYAEIIEE